MAERGRERKGKLSLDWDELLPTGNGDDDEPPALQVVPETGVSNSCSVVIDEEDDNSFRDLEIRRKSDHDLKESIKRMKSCLTGGLVLSDGGEKLRAYLKRMEAELERRTLQKEDNNCGTTAPSTDEPTSVDAVDDISIGSSPLVSVPRSSFGLKFCSKLDNDTGHGTAQSFGAQLNDGHDRNTTENCQFRTQKTKEISLISRKQPFESPVCLSLKNDEQSQSNVGQFKRRSSILAPHQSEEGTPGYLSKKKNVFSDQPSRSTKRRNCKTVFLSDEEELETDAGCQVDLMDESIKGKRIYYPSRDDPEAVEISYSDMQCLAPKSYLSSPIMNFYIRYLQKPTSPTSTHMCDYHFFNTFFYSKLKGGALNKSDKETSFAKFRRWWKGVDIFEKAYIFLPVHEHLHWSLIIICIPDKEDESGPIILHLDSLGMHDSDEIFDDVMSFLIEEWRFLGQEGVPLKLPIADKIWKRLSRRIDVKVIEVPQQRNEYDCGLFVLFFMERFLDEAPDRLRKKDLAMFGRQWFRPQEASNLRQKIADLLREEFKKSNVATQ